MSSVPIHYIDLRSFCYATEDEHRVETALRTVLPPEFPIERTQSEGFHGDPIVVLSARVDTADEIRHVLDRLMTLDDLPRVRDELDDRVDDNCSFYLQLDKQAAYRGRIALGRGIMLRAKVEAYPAKHPLAVANLEDVFAG